MKSLVKVLLCLAAFSPLSMNAQWCGSCCDSEQYYVSVWGGGNVAFNTHPDLDTGWYVGGALGYRCSSSYRFDLSFDYLRNEIDNDSSWDEYYSSSDNEDVSKYVVLANAYYDFCPWGCVVPYVGGGIGYAYIHTDEHSHHHFDKNAFAWQIGAGLTYEINSCWSASASYRLLGTTNDGTAYHNLFGVGLTRQF